MLLKNKITFVLVCVCAVWTTVFTNQNEELKKSCQFQNCLLILHDNSKLKKKKRKEEKIYK